MQQTELSAQFQQVLERSERRVQIINYVLAVLLIIILAWALFAAWRNSQVPRIERIAISNVRVLGERSLCPGDTLMIGYDASVVGSGTVKFGYTVYHNNQPVILSSPDELPIEGPVTLHMVDTWEIPSTPTVRVSGMAEWLPGKYERLIEISAPDVYASRYTTPAMLKAKFEIREDCK